MFAVNPSLIWAIGGVIAALTCGTLVRIVALRKAPTDVVRSRLGSLQTWWALAALLSTAAVLQKPGVALLLAVAAALSLHEFLNLVGREHVGRLTMGVVFAFIPAYYLAALLGHHELLRQAAPAAFVLVMGGLRAAMGLTQGYLRTTSALILGLMLFIYALSHGYFLLELQTSAQPPVGRVGWFLFLVLLTETDDIVQALVGRRIGKTKITPCISPNKSLEGLLGGVMATMALAVFTAPWLTQLTAGDTRISGILKSLAAGLLISVCGFLGDINMSGIKRDAGVKDGSSLLPGQGGLIDRIDSLTFTAPAFYYFIRSMA